MIDDLKIILEKDPIVSTYSAKDLINSPESVEQYYTEVSKTHVSIGDTNKYEKRLYDCLVKNKTTFNGAVIGEYGFGKTSILIHLWEFCNRNNIMAIPPYQWSEFQEHFQAIYHWIIYKLRKNDVKIINKFDNCFSKYRDSSVEAKAKEWAETHSMDYETALGIITKEFKSGKMTLQFTPADLLQFCDDTTILLQNFTKYDGLLVITDELQQTILDISPKQVYDYLFNIVNALCIKKGNYGFLWGFPEKTFADILRERSDIIDRLHSNKAFIRLHDIYDNKFPLYLWESYSKLFGFKEIGEKVVNEYTLLSIGQISDGERRDLGNGPRSVISAFNSMVDHYINYNSRYEVIDFVNDCLKGEITLGGGSDFKKRVDALLNIETIGQKYEKLIKIMAGFPEGVLNAALKEYELFDEIDHFTKETGGLGKVVIKNINLYALKTLKKQVDEYEETVIEDEIRNFYSIFSNDAAYRNIAHKVFNEIIAEYIFKSTSKDIFEGWKIESPWTLYREGFRAILNGSFNAKYPQRKVVLFSVFENEEKPAEMVKAEFPEEHFAFNFVLHHKIRDDFNYSIKELQKGTYLINLNLLYQGESLSIKEISQIIPTEKQTPLFFFSLVDHLSNANIPKNEIPQLDFIKTKLIENVIYNLFNEDMIGEVENSIIEINNEGEYLIPDLFSSACAENFSEYNTLMTSKNWSKKITTYLNVLNMSSTKISLLQKRGKEAVVFYDDPKKNKAEIANLFNQKSTAFESWLNDLKSMVDYKFGTQESKFIFQTHPLERYLLDKIESEGKNRHIDNVLCRTFSLTKDTLTHIKNIGYLNEEILLILRIGEARKYFNFDPEQRLIYKKPEDKHELQEHLNEFLEQVRKQVQALMGFDDYPNNIEKINEIEESISLVENKEQAENYLNSIKQIQSLNKHFCKKTLEQVINIEIVKDKEILKSEENELKKLLNEKISIDVLGKVKWVNELAKIRINIKNEIIVALKTTKNLMDKIEKCVPPTIPNNVHVITIFIETFKAYNETKKELNDQQLLNNKLLKDKVYNFVKWTEILKLAGDVDQQIEKYKNFGFEEKFDEDNTKIIDEIVFNLQNNEKSTLENHENFRQLLRELMTRLRTKISGLKEEWEKRKSYYDENLKKITGSIPHSKVRWSESPELSYQDLYEYVDLHITNYLSQQKRKIEEVLDDVTYTMEVLNHKKAIQNKEIDSKLKEIENNIEFLIKKDLLEDIKRRETFEELVKNLVQINETYIELNREHRLIIKPIKIELADEQNFFNLLDKNAPIDLKKLIIDYQKKCKPDINLAESREEVLNILKELFLKKQIGIAIRKGKN